MSAKVFSVALCAAAAIALATVAGSAAAPDAPAAKATAAGASPEAAAKATGDGAAFLNGVNTLLEGTGITLEMLQDGEDRVLGVRIEPPLGVNVSDDNCPPKTAARKTVGTFVATVDVLSADGRSWANLTASNAEAAGAYCWEVWLTSLPADGLPVILGDNAYKFQTDGGADGGLSLVKDAAATSPAAERPGVSNRRPHDHIGNFSSIGAAAKMLAGGGGHQATRKIVGLSIDAKVAAPDDGPASVMMNMDVQPSAGPACAGPDGAAGGQPPAPRGALVDLVADSGGGPVATLASGAAYGRPDRIIVWPDLANRGLPIHFGGQTYVLSVADGSLVLAPAP
jgi:hypothetical protein